MVVTKCAQNNILLKIRSHIVPEDRIPFSEELQSYSDLFSQSAASAAKSEGTAVRFERESF
ncbi:uncharacterized protein PHALS_10827 [Plasmopara halstedii]|uniref:Uncharacterized protein n=1 Tax=Plasmopara halstedii TaxID=4781 RepID=A0A0P1AHL2_PLAHL|nr:uncharacterized protein PHALS_10827 [Plasmopara halstedii]CEG40641.1 hypothetical protein PHALS_10827 [Plasmopara halstedii]|eukprot:XP_024577010.1 hypothetical protein PHALS_10827 [Plasmopara halstedii]